MLITLNDNQKQFLFDKKIYVDREVLDSLNYKGWENYFIKNFYWKLETELNCWRMRELVLINKETGEIDYTIELNFQRNDLKTLLEIRQ
jgi:hypothetical protein